MNDESMMPEQARRRGQVDTLFSAAWFERESLDSIEFADEKESDGRFPSAMERLKALPAIAWATALVVAFCGVVMLVAGSTAAVGIVYQLVQGA